MYIQPLLYLLCTVFLGLILTNQYGVAKGIALIISLHFSTYYSKGIFTPTTICRVVGVGKVTELKRLRLHFGDIRVKVTPLTLSRSLFLSKFLHQCGVFPWVYSRRQESRTTMNFFHTASSRKLRVFVTTMVVFTTNMEQGRKH